MLKKTKNKMKHPTLIIDDFLGKSYSDRILDLVANSPNEFPWTFIATDVTNPGMIIDEQQDLKLGFSNCPLLDGMTNQFFPLFLPMLDSIQDHLGTKCEFLRLRLALQLKDGSDRSHNTPHVDMYDDHYTALYYINDSDGDTHLFDQYDKPYGGTSLVDRIHKIKAQNYTVNQTVSPKKNRLLIFDGHQLHASSHPKENPYRIVLNINFITEKPIF